MANGRKKIIIVNNNFLAGGVQRSLVNLLHEISGLYDVTVFVFHNHGIYKNEIPCSVNVIEAYPLLQLLGMSQQEAKKRGWFLYFFRGILAMFSKIAGNRLPVNLLLASDRRFTGYDAAISFLHYDNDKVFHGGCNEFVLKNVEANKKIAFLHCDFNNYGGNSLKNRKGYQQFHKIAVVSQGCKESFLKAMPEMAPKVYYAANCHQYNEYLNKANDHPVQYEKGYLNILTAARLSEEKGIMRAINVMSRLIQEGYSVKWHIIGGGPQRDEILNLIDKKHLSQTVFLYGMQKNPYRFMKNADILLIPSFHEAAPMVIEEAKSIGLPVITADTISAEEMVKHETEGYVCANNEEGIYEAIKTAVKNPDKIKQFKKYLSQKRFNNNDAVAQFKKIVDNN